MFWLFVAKELKSIARDPKMLIAMVIIPLVLTAVLYSVLGHGLVQQIEQAVKGSSVIAVIDMDKSNESRQFTEFLQSIGLVVKKIDVENGNEINLHFIKGLDTKILYVVPEGFGHNLSSFVTSRVYAYIKLDSLTIGESGIMEAANRYLELFNRYLITKLARERGIPEEFMTKTLDRSVYGVLVDKVVENPGKVLMLATVGGIFVPLIVFTLIMFAAQLVATSIAVEKEEKMFETLLSLPISRMKVIGSKLFVSILISGVYMVSYAFLLFGLFLSNIYSTILGVGMDMVFIPGSVVLYMLANIAGLTLFMVSIALLLGLLAEDVRTAQTIVGNIAGPTIVLIYVPMFVDVISNQTLKLALSLTPIANTVLLPKLVIVQDSLPLAIASVSNLVYGLAIFMVIKKVVNSEIVFTLKLRRKKIET